jgi:NAD(P)H-flavin reductase/ferredoxin
MPKSGYTVRLKPGNEEFQVDPGEAVLNAALRQGVSLRYGCRHGNCSSCKYFLISGDVDFGVASPYSLSESEREEGWALLCCATPTTDLDVQDFSVSDDRALPVLAPVVRAAVIRSVERLGGELWHLELDMPEPLRFYAGQFVELEVPGRPGIWRSYSLATPPSSRRRLGFVVKHIADGQFSGQLDSFREGTPVQLRGPYGTGYLRDGDRPVVLVATGAGISPILSILSHAAEREDKRSFSLFYGARSRADLVMAERLEQLGAELDLATTITLSQPTDECRWTGPRGRVTTVVQRQVDDASAFDAYLCGKPEMCDSIALLLEAKGIPDGHIFFDRFYPADDGLS